MTEIPDRDYTRLPPDAVTGAVAHEGLEERPYGGPEGGGDADGGD